MLRLLVVLRVRVQAGAAAATANDDGDDDAPLLDAGDANEGRFHWLWRWFRR